MANSELSALPDQASPASTAIMYIVTDPGGGGEADEKATLANLATALATFTGMTNAFVAKSLYDANTILAATSDNTPVALTVAASRILGRKSSGDIAAMTAAEARAVLAMPGEILGVTTYDPGSLATYTFTSSTPSDADATNLSVTFTAPASGAVDVHLEAVCNTGSGTSLTWNLRTTGGADVSGTDLRVCESTGQVRIHVTIPVSGLTAGASTTYRWGAARDTGTGTCVFYAGGITGPATMRVVAR